MSQFDRVQQALEELVSADVSVRVAAIEILAEHRHVPAISHLVLMLDDADPGMRFVIVKALGQIGDDSAVPALLDALRGDDMWTRAAAAGALIRIGAASLSGLVKALRDEDKAVRRAAAKALGKIDDRSPDTYGDVLNCLSVALLDVDAGVRRFAAEALGRLGADAKVPELSEVLSDRDADVRIAAFRALAQIATPEAQTAIRSWVKS